MIKLIGKVEYSIFEGLGEINSKYKISIKDNVISFSINVPRPVPIYLQILVKDELDKIINLRVIEEDKGAAEWCSPMVVAMMANGKVRICSDMTRLNKAVRREINPMTTVETSLAKISCKIFSKL